MRVVGLLPKDTYGFTYDGLHSGRDFDMWLLKSPIPILSGARSADDNAIRSDETYSDFLGLEPISLQFELVLHAKNEADLRQKRHRIAAWLSPRQKAKRLISDLEPDKYYLAVRRGGQQDMNMLVSQGYFTLEMKVNDPFMYDVGETPGIIDNKNLSTTVTNVGLAETFPTIIIQGHNLTQLTFNISQLNDYDKQFVIDLPTNYALQEGDTLTIDCRRSTAFFDRVDGRRQNALPFVSTVFPHFLPETTYDVTLTGYDPLSFNRYLSIQIYPNSRWE